jgi:diaminohydroxyphosphoribosylaminopyrimidine deaminase/5-amino-6-(5-phosphoribosylamino)uracil reductase
MIEVEDKYMARCLQLARGGEGFVAPNPMVGAVVVHDGRIIGEGYHRQFGGPHAEVNAIASVSHPELLSDSTLYVSLEPCSHYGKTPPCAGLIIKKHIPRVVVACMDPFPQVSGRGVEMLRNAGVEVVTGVLESEAKKLNKAFMTFQEKHRPYIILKWAQSVDGFIDKLRNGATDPKAVISTDATRRHVHKLRTEVAAILVGTRTALLDDPSLTVRHWIGKNPVRLAVDRTLKIPEGYHLLDGTVPTILFTEKAGKTIPGVEYEQVDFVQPLVPQILDSLYRRKLNSLLVEGGTMLLNQFIEMHLWDEARVETGKMKLGRGVKAPKII